MTLTKRKNLLTDFFDNEHFFDIFPNELVSRTPSVNIIENGKEFKIELSAPGLKKEDFKIDIDNSTLTIRAEKEVEQKEEKEHYTKREFSYSSFSRSFLLPDTVNKDQVKANYEDGLLKIQIGKKEEAKQIEKKQIKVS